jgi:hypothetical protein
MESAVVGRGYAEPSTMGRTARRGVNVASENDPWVVRIAILTLAFVTMIVAYKVPDEVARDFGLIALGAVAGLATKTSAATP